MVTAERTNLLRAMPAKATDPDDRVQSHLHLQYAVAEILSEATDEHLGSAAVMRALCERLNWIWGGVWIRRDDGLRLLTCWHAPGCITHEFDHLSKTCHFLKGEGMPGHVWQQDKALWVGDFTADERMPRRLAAERCGLHSAVGAPIVGREFMGVIELFSDKVLEPDTSLLQTLTALAAQLGQFLERKHAEHALAESQGLFLGVFQGAQDAILLANDSGEYIEANPAALKLFGLPREKIIGQHVWNLTPMGSEDDARRLWTEFLRLPSMEGGFALRAADGSTIQVEFRATARVIPGVHLSVLRDVTARKHREQSARLLAEAGAILGEGLDYRATIERVARVALPEFADWCILDMWSADGRIERAAMAHTDPKTEQTIRQLQELYPLNPTRKFGSPNVLRTGQTEFLEITENLLRRATIDERHFQLASSLELTTAIISPLTTKEKTIAALSFWRTKSRSPFTKADIELADELARRAAWALENARLYESSKQQLQLREKAETELKKLNRELEKRVEDRTSALQESHAELESFCYSVSHDLRAPLRSMQGFSHALLEDHAPNLNDEGRDFAQRILAAAEHMDGLLADVLSYSRLSRQELKLEPTDVDAVFADLRVHLQGQINTTKADVQLTPCNCSVLANRTVLELMLVNLLDNALKFIPPDRTPKILISAERRGPAWRLWVRDNGIGIAREHQQKIFRIFERLHGVETYPGTGIGLALVQKAAERMSGSVGVVSKPGDGSAFWIELPAAE